MLSKSQKALIKMAQREAALSDSEYRECLEMVTGRRSSTDPSLGDRSFDKVLAFFDAIHWRKVDSGALQPPCNPDAVFRQRGHWAAKNTREETSRDRYVRSNLGEAISQAEGEIAEVGCGEAYCAVIRRRAAGDRTDAPALRKYLHALQRTLKSKTRHPSELVTT